MGKSLKILMVVHGIPPESLGGTETATWRLAKALATQHTISIFCPARPNRREQLGLSRSFREGIEVLQVHQGLTKPSNYSDSYQNAHVEKCFSSLIKSRPLDLIHFQHLSGLSMALPSIAKTESIPTVLTLHDAWLPCARGQLLDVNLDLCDGPSPSGCARCVMDQLSMNSPMANAAKWLRRASWPGKKFKSPSQGQPPTSTNTAKQHLENWILEHKPITQQHKKQVLHREHAARRAVESSDIITAPSHHLLNTFKGLGWLDGRTPQQAICLDNLLPDVSMAPPIPPPMPLKLLFIGSCIPSKGVHLLMQAVSQFSEQEVQLTIVGPTPAYHRYPNYGEWLKQLCASNTHSLGPLPPAQAIAQLQHHHALVLPSIWPENAPVTLRESLLAGRPVLASDIGGIPEVVTPGISGLLFKTGSVSALAGSIRQLINPVTWEFLQSQVAQLDKRHLGASKEDWNSLYLSST